MADTGPFKHRPSVPPTPTRVLHRFRKGRDVVEIRERNVVQFAALEILVFWDDTLHFSEMFYGARLAEYPRELAAVRDQYVQDEWVEDTIDHPVA